MAVTVVPVGAVSSTMTLPVLIFGPANNTCAGLVYVDIGLVYDPVASRLVL